MDFLIVIVLFAFSGLFTGFPDRFGRTRFENWILSKEPKPYVLYVLCFGCLGWTGYSGYMHYKLVDGGNFFYEASLFLLPLLLFPYLTSLIGERLEIDKKEKSK